MSTPRRPRLRRRFVVPVAALAVVGVSGGAIVLSGCGDTASAGSAAASVAGYIPASSPVYVQVSTDTSGPQWTQLTDLARYFPAYGTMQARVEKELQKEGISWQTDLKPLLGDAAALATTKVPDAANVAKGALTNPAGAAGRALATAADQPVLAVLQIASGKADQVKALLADPANGGLSAAGEYNGAAMYSDPTGGMHAAVAPEALIIGSSEAVVKQAIDAHAEGGDQALSGVFRFNDALALLPRDVFAMAYVNIDELGKAASDIVPMAGDLVDGEITGAAAMSLTAETDGLHMKAVLVDAPAVADQKAFTPTLTNVAPADAIAYLGFNRLADTVARVISSASASASPEVKKQIDAVTGQLPVLLGVTADDLRNLTGGEHAVVVGGAQPTPSVSLALKTADGAQADETLTSLSKSLPLVLGQFGPSGKLKTAAAKGFTPVNLGGVAGHELAVNSTGDIVWGVKGDLAVIGSRAAGVSTLLNGTGPGLADSAAFTAATQGMPDQVTGLAWINVPQAMPMLAEKGAFAGKDGAGKREALSHVSGIAAWGTPGANPTVDVFVGLQK